MEGGFSAREWAETGPARAGKGGRQRCIYTPFTQACSAGSRGHDDDDKNNDDDYCDDDDHQEDPGHGDDDKDTDQDEKDDLT